MDRRKFMLDTGRLSLLGGIVATTGYLISNRTTDDLPSCSFTPVCDRCRSYKSCAKVPDNKRPGNGN